MKLLSTTAVLLSHHILQCASQTIVPRVSTITSYRCGTSPASAASSSPPSSILSETISDAAQTVSPTVSSTGDAGATIDPNLPSLSASSSSSDAGATFDPVLPSLVSSSSTETTAIAESTIVVTPVPQESSTTAPSSSIDLITVSGPIVSDRTSVTTISVIEVTVSPVPESSGEAESSTSISFSGVIPPIISAAIPTADASSSSPIVVAPTTTTTPSSSSPVVIPPVTTTTTTTPPIIVATTTTTTSTPPIVFPPTTTTTTTTTPIQPSTSTSQGPAPTACSLTAQSLVCPSSIAPLISFPDPASTTTFYFSLACKDFFSDTYPPTDDQLAFAVVELALRSQDVVGECLAQCDLYNRNKGAADSPCAAGVLVETSICYIFDDAGRASVGNQAFAGLNAFLRRDGTDAAREQVCGVTGLQGSFD